MCTYSGSGVEGAPSDALACFVEDALEDATIRSRPIARARFIVRCLTYDLRIRSANLGNPGSTQGHTQLDLR